MNSFKSWVLAARPKTLTASLIPIIACIGLVMSEGFIINWEIVLCAVLSSFFIQIGTNLVNDAKDAQKGADTEERIGPKRVTQQGVFTYKQVMTAAGLCFFISVLFGLYLVFKGGLPIVIIGLVSVFMGYAYTAGPYPLAYKGLGDLFVILFFGLVAVGGVYYLLTGTYQISAFILGLQIGLLSTILIAINNLRDIETDSKVNKKTLAVRLGVKLSKVWVIFLIVSPFLVGYYWLFNQKIYFYLVPLFCFPLGISLIKKIIRTEPSEKYNQFLAQASLYALLFSILFFIGTQFNA